jgi:ATP-dependent DNA ligase
MLQRIGRVAGLVEPCLPSPAKAPPSGPDWLHEIKHVGFRILALRDAAGVRLCTRNGHDFSKRFPLVMSAVATLPVRSCLIDGEAIVSDDSGLAVLNLLRSWPTNLSAVLCAFDLLELDGEDLRRSPIEMRKAGLIQLHCASRTQASRSTSTSSVPATSSTGRPAGSAANASCRGGSARRTAPADRSAGLRSRTRRRLRCGARRKNNGVEFAVFTTFVSR